MEEKTEDIIFQDFLFSFGASAVCDGGQSWKVVVLSQAQPSLGYIQAPGKSNQEDRRRKASTTAATTWMMGKCPFGEH